MTERALTQKKTDDKKHFGLKGMKKRADLIGAELFISSEQDYGTQIKIIKPENVLYKHTGGV